MILIEPTMEYDKEIQAFKQDFQNHESSLDGSGNLRRFDNTKDWLDFVNKFKDPATAPKTFVPTTQYIFVREEDRKVVGVIQVRHYFNEFLREFGGHIGYSVCPSERKKGYGSLMLKMILPKCKELGIDKLLITCVKGNLGSRGVILNNGGIYESTVYCKERDYYLERYWIDLSDIEEE